MSALESLGIKRLESATWYVHDLVRARAFYTEKLDLAEVGTSSSELDARGKQTSAVFQGGDLSLICSAPAGQNGRAARFLKKHPEGIGTLTFEVADIAKTRQLLDQRGATFLDDTYLARDEKGTISFFSITTPFGDTTFRFVQRDGYQALFPGFVAHPEPKGGKNRLGILRIDHVTSNFRTTRPMALWLQHVMGFEEFWSIQFHTEDEVTEGRSGHGSGLKSVVLWDPKSQVKFANNEPAAPAFKQSQINVFVEEHRGEGVQHLALEVRDIVACVKALREENGVDFLHTPGAYYDYLPERLVKSTIGSIDEDQAELRKLEILVDGSKPRRYLLQIFMKTMAALFGDPEAGPFFYEIIQRKGDRGFGGGNFRALFESIERMQKAQAEKSLSKAG
jgi:4-hydroxyphenylpyruvate dioxygenase